MSIGFYPRRSANMSRPSMTRQHFKALAHALAQARPDLSHDAYDDHRQAYRQWEYTVGCIANACQRANSNFDRGRFLTACKEW